MPQSLEHIAKQLAGGATLEELRTRQSNAKQLLSPQSRPQTEEEKARELAYWEKVFAEREKQQNPIKPRSFRQEMEYADARVRLIEILNKRADFIAVNESKPGFKWTFTLEDGEVIQNLIKWFINDPSGAYPINRGLYVYGKPGTGKTEILQCLIELGQKWALSKCPDYSRLSETYTMAKADAGYDPVTTNVQFDRVFDEFGRFTGAVKRYGDDLDINEAIIEAREARWKRYGQLTILISNGSKDQIQGLFSSMLFDRIRSFTTDVHFSGDSKR